MSLSEAVIAMLSVWNVGAPGDAMWEKLQNEYNELACS